MRNADEQGMLKTYTRPFQPPGRRVIGLLCMVSVLLAACVNTESSAGPEQAVSRLPTDAEVEQYNAQAAPDDRIICRNEVPVGSNIPRRTCRFVSDIEETSRFTRDQLRNVLQ